MPRKERRRRRFSFSTKVILTFAGTKRSIKAESKNVSVNGIFIKSAAKIPVDTHCDIEIIISGKTSRLRMELEGKVVRRDGEGIGIEFLNPMEWFALFPIYDQYGRRDAKEASRINFGTYSRTPYTENS